VDCQSFDGQPSWHFAACCPLRGGRGEFRKKTPKTIKEKKDKTN
jgi:hypothetical protein